MRYQERGVSAQLKNNLMHVIEQNKSINHQNHVCGAPTKARLFLHELIPWISIIRNYENKIHAYFKTL